MCVNLRASWQGRLAKMPNLFSHSRKHSQQDCLLKNRKAPPFESREPDFQQDYFLKNRRDTVIRISRVRLPTELLSQKSKRHRSPNLESQNPNRITCSKIKEAPPSESREPDSQQDYFLKNRKDTALRISRARLPTRLFSQKSKRHSSLNLESQIPDRIACLKTEEAQLFEL
ncbi:hypothetical protein TB1_046293 [Malus domestica]